MPYIKAAARKRMRTTEVGPTGPGELNYHFTKAIDEYLDLHGIHYLAINDVIGALEGAKLEFYRRVVAPYEDQKLEENGDVYTSRQG